MVDVSVSMRVLENALAEGKPMEEALAIPLVAQNSSSQEVQKIIYNYNQRSLAPPKPQPIDKPTDTQTKGSRKISLRLPNEIYYWLIKQGSISESITHILKEAMERDVDG